MNIINQILQNKLVYVYLDGVDSSIFWCGFHRDFSLELALLMVTDFLQLCAVQPQYEGFQASFHLVCVRHKGVAHSDIALKLCFTKCLKNGAKHIISLHMVAMKIVVSLWFS